MERADETRVYGVAKFECGSCHTIDSSNRPTGGQRQGPPLGDILDRAAARESNYRYLDELKNSGGVWTV